MFRRSIHTSLAGLAVLAACTAPPTEESVLSKPPELFDLDTQLLSRSISFENPTGEVGAGGQAASPLGVGRKGAPARFIAPGETVQLADIEGMGTLRHIWMTTYNRPEIFRGAVVRAWWDDQEHPSIEAPLGDFAGFAHGQVRAYQSAVHSLGERAAMNVWLPMPFTSRARVEIENQSSLSMAFFYQIDYTLGDEHPEDVGRLHVLFRRENPTTLGEDFELLPTRRGKGRFLGAVVGIRPLVEQWWGEGEIKIYLDGDDEFATLVGTGSEDWVGLSFGIQETPYRYHGANLVTDELISMYRWHIPDPIYWREDVRVTIQQIGHDPNAEGEYLDRLFERQDDWSTATFWYEPVPSAPLPPLPSLEARLEAMVPEAD